MHERVPKRNIIVLRTKIWRLPAKWLTSFLGFDQSHLPRWLSRILYYARDWPRLIGEQANFVFSDYGRTLINPDDVGGAAMAILSSSRRLRAAGAAGRPATASTT
jgi:hypothetical protein